MSFEKEMKQKELIFNGTWDVLIIIDACRFDKFVEVYKEIFENGKLDKAITPATWTGAWVIEIFEDMFMPDVVFLSTTIWISSKNEKEKTRVITQRLRYGHRLMEFDSRKHFKKIIDIDEPEHLTSVTDKLIKTVESYPGNKIICKYLQIHHPYLYYVEKERERSVKKEKLDSYRDNIYEFINLFLSDETITNIRVKLGKPPIGDITSTYVKYGREGVVKGYTEDLKTILKEVKRAREKFPNKKIVITSDHGELLGEKGRYSHGGFKRGKEIMEVPWFEI